MNKYTTGAFFVVMAIVVVYAYSIPRVESLVERSGDVVKLYKVVDEDTIYKGCATLEDTTISNVKALRAFTMKETERLIYDSEKGVIKRKQKPPK